MDDLHVFNESNLLAQIARTEPEFGCYKVHFYTRGSALATTPTDVISDFYLFPTGGTLRDSNFNIVFYSTRFDIYKGFRPPALEVSPA